MARILEVETARRVFVASLVAGLLLLLPGSWSDRGTGPSFVVILADDMGYSDIGSYGGEIATRT